MRVDMRLSAASVRRGIARLKSARLRLIEDCDLICSRLAEIGLATAVQIVPNQTGFLRDSIAIVKKGDARWVVVARSEYAAFVEFGTGVVGEGTYPGTLPAAWSYRLGERENPGAHDPDDPTVWFWLGDDGRYHATRGREGAGYMAAAADQVLLQAGSIAREVMAR